MFIYSIGICVSFLFFIIDIFIILYKKKSQEAKNFEKIKFCYDVIYGKYVSKGKISNDSFFGKIALYFLLIFTSFIMAGYLLFKWIKKIVKYYKQPYEAREIIQKIKNKDISCGEMIRLINKYNQYSSEKYRLCYDIFEAEEIGSSVYVNDGNLFVEEHSEENDYILELNIDDDSFYYNLNNIGICWKYDDMDDSEYTTKENKFNGFEKFFYRFNNNKIYAKCEDMTIFGYSIIKDGEINKKDFGKFLDSFRFKNYLDIESSIKKEVKEQNFSNFSDVMPIHANVLNSYKKYILAYLLSLKMSDSEFDKYIETEIEKINDARNKLIKYCKKLKIILEDDDCLPDLIEKLGADKKHDNKKKDLEEFYYNLENSVGYSIINYDWEISVLEGFRENHKAFQYYCGYKIY